MRSDTPTTNVQISIHVPRVEDDLTKSFPALPQNRISIHVPRVEDDI